MKNRAIETEYFLTIFGRLRNACKNTPARISWMAENDEKFQRLCDELYWAGEKLRLAERRFKRLYIQDVADDYIDAWREYEEHYEVEVNPINRLRLDIAAFDPEITGASNEEPASAIDLAWESADDTARGHFEGLGDALEEIENRILLDTGPGGRKSFEDWAKYDGLNAFDELRRKGFDISGILRRRRLCPVYLLPQARRVNYIAGGNYLKLLEASQDAFILGVFPASASLNRANLEAVAEGLWGAGSWGLAKKIDFLKVKVPEHIHSACLEIKLLGDGVLHGRADAKDAFTHGKEIELRLLNSLLAIRWLIERSPEEGAIQ